MEREPKTIREIMPGDFTMILAKELNADPANVSRVISLEKTTSKYWPAIARLALKTDPKEYRARMKWLEQQKKLQKAEA